MNNEPISDEELLSKLDQEDFWVGRLEEDPGKVLQVLAQESKNIAIPQATAIKLGQALIKVARVAQESAPKIIMSAPDARQ